MSRTRTAAPVPGAPRARGPTETTARNCSTTRRRPATSLDKEHEGRPGTTGETTMSRRRSESWAVGVTPPCADPTSVRLQGPSRKRPFLASWDLGRRLYPNVNASAAHFTLQHPAASCSILQHPCGAGVIATTAAVESPGRLAIQTTRLPTVASLRSVLCIRTARVAHCRLCPFALRARCIFCQSWLLKHTERVETPRSNLSETCRQPVNKADSCRSHAHVCGQMTRVSR